MADKQTIKLAKKAKRGNKKAFEELYNLKLRYIVYSAYVILGNHHDAEDIAQEVMFVMYQTIHKLREPAAVDSWIFRITRNACLKLINSRKGFGTEMLDFDDESIPQPIEEDTDYLPEKYMESRELSDLLRGVIMKLPQKQRETVFMYYYDDLKYKEIAEATGTTTNTVSTNLLKAKKMIKESLEKIEAEQGKLAATGVVLAKVLRDGDQIEVSAQTLDKLQLGAKTMLVSQAFTAAKVMTVKVVVTAALAVSVIAGSFVGVDYLIQQQNTPTKTAPTEPIIAATPEIWGRILFTSQDGTGAQVNPVNASLDIDGGNLTEVIWSIIDLQTGQTLYQGNGLELAEPFAQMKSQGLAGDFDLVFDWHDASGHTFSFDRIFTLKG